MLQSLATIFYGKIPLEEISVFHIFVFLLFIEKLIDIFLLLMEFNAMLYHNIDKLVGNVINVLASNRCRPEADRIFWLCFPHACKGRRKRGEDGLKLCISLIRLSIDMNGQI